MSGAMIKVGIYGLLRMLTVLGPPQPWWGWLLIATGASSGVLGVLFALAQHDLKRLLAYHSVENIGIILLGIGIGVVGLADPTTHLELTMIHEVMVLDHSGPDFAAIQYGAAVKLWLIGSLLVGVAVPVRSGTLWLDGAAMLAGMAALGIVVGMIESTMARYRLTQVPAIVVGGATLSAVAFLVNLM